MKIFKNTLIISVVVGVLILLSRFAFDYLSIILVFAGVFVASFLPYLDYLLITFYTETQNDSKDIIKGFFMRREYIRLISFIDENRDNELRPAINSAHFQVILAILGFYFLTTYPQLFGFSLLLSLMFNLNYRLYLARNYYFNWFWVFKNPVSSRFVQIWLFGNLLIGLIYLFAV